MLLLEFKGFLAPPKNSILSEAPQRTVFFAVLTKEKYLKTDISGSQKHQNLGLD